MGGSSSRELSKRKRKREKRQDVLSNEHSYNGSGTRNFGYNSRDTMTNMDNQPGCNPEFSKLFDLQRDFYHGNRSDFDDPIRNDSSLGEDVVGKFGVNLENLNNFHERTSSANDRYKERQPRRRHHSFNENRFQFQNGQGTMNGFGSSRIKCNSLINLNGRGSPFEGQYMGNRFTNFSSCNLPVQNHYFDTTSLSRCDDESSVGRGGIKRYSCNGYSEDVSWADGSNGACEELLLFDSPTQPRVKRRLSDEDRSVECLSSDNRNRSDNERSHSGLSFYSNTTSNSADTDSAKTLSNEACGALDILSFPTEWSSCAVDKTGYVSISSLSSEGRSVQKYFERTCRSKDSFLSISSIIRIENPFLHTLYLLKKEEMIVKNGHVDELFLYHGTKKRNVSNICEDNLDWRRYSGMHRFGKGVSFSPSAMYSSHYSDEGSRGKIVMLFKVLVSKSILGLPEMDIPLNDEGVSYDTSIKEDASVIVKYCDNEFYPLYKIVYNKV